MVAASLRIGLPEGRSNVHEDRENGPFEVDVAVRGTRPSLEIWQLMQSLSSLVGQNVKRYRVQHKLSVSELARRSGVSKATLLAVEIGETNPTIDTLQSIATSLEVSVGDLVAKVAAISPFVVRHDSPDDWHIHEDFRLRAMGTIYGADMVHILDGIVNETGYSSDGHEAGSVEFICVLRGTLLAGDPDDPVELHVGDWMRYAADRPHIVRAAKGTAEGILIMRRSEAAINFLPVERAVD